MDKTVNLLQTVHAFKVIIQILMKNAKNVFGDVHNVNINQIYA